MFRQHVILLKSIFIHLFRKSVSDGHTDVWSIYFVLNKYDLRFWIVSEMALAMVFKEDGRNYGWMDRQSRRTVMRCQTDSNAMPHIERTIPREHQNRKDNLMDAGGCMVDNR